jgi:hypothetical protein
VQVSDWSDSSPIESGKHVLFSDLAAGMARSLNMIVPISNPLAPKESRCNIKEKILKVQPGYKNINIEYFASRKQMRRPTSLLEHVFTSMRNFAYPLYLKIRPESRTLLTSSLLNRRGSKVFYLTQFP